jgi:hypothetical protein
MHDTAMRRHGEALRATASVAQSYAGNCGAKVTRRSVNYRVVRVWASWVWYRKVKVRPRTMQRSIGEVKLRRVAQRYGKALQSRVTSRIGIAGVRFV